MGRHNHDHHEFASEAEAVGNEDVVNGSGVVGLHPEGGSEIEFGTPNALVGCFCQELSVDIGICVWAVGDPAPEHISKGVEKQYTYYIVLQATDLNP
jgi:hypothetical protein